MIDHVAVVGVGTMGRGVVWALAQAGVNVTLKERSMEQARESLQMLEADLDNEIERWTLTKAEKASILSRVHPSAKMEDLAQAQLLIECVPDDLEIKRRVFCQLDQSLPPEMIFVSNTSSLSITELAGTTSRPDRFLGMHFSLPVPKRPLVELIRGRQTTAETVGKARRLAIRMGKTAIEVFESPGFVTTRMITPYLNEAMHIVMEGIASAEDVDTAMRLSYDFSIGPLAMADKMGLDEVLLWMEKLFHEIGDVKYRPCPLLRRLVFEGHLGVKTGSGFFQYDSAGHRISADDQHEFSIGGAGR